MLKEAGMSIITISRGSYSHGKEVAEALADKLHYDCLSREIMVETSDQFKIPEKKLLRAMHDAPTAFEWFNHDQERLVHFFRSTFLSHMAQGNIVYHGLAGHFFLQNISHVLKVRIIANMEDRVKEETTREKCSAHDALKKLKLDDKERHKWSLHLYGKDTWDCRLYDMVLCVDSLTVDDAVELLAQTAQKKQFQATEASLAELKQRVLCANILAKVYQASSSAKVRFVNDNSIELIDTDGPLKTDKIARKDFSSQMKELYHIEEVLYKEPLHPFKGHINTFYNVDVH